MRRFTAVNRVAPNRNAADTEAGHTRTRFTTLEGGAAGGERACGEDHGGELQCPRRRPGPMDARAGVAAVGADPVGACRRLLAGPPAASSGPPRADDPPPRAALHRGDRRHGDGRGGAGQPPSASSRRLAAARLGAVGDRRWTDRQLRPIRAPGQPGSGPGRRPCSRARRHLRPLAGLHRLHPAAHTDGLAAFPALAMVGRDRRCRAAGMDGGEGEGSLPSTRSGTHTSYPPWRLRPSWSRCPRS